MGYPSWALEHASMSLNGTALSGTDYKVMIRSGDDQLWPGFTRSRHSLLGGHGSLAYGAWFSEREIVVPCTMYAEDFAGMLAQMDNLTHLLNSEQDMELVFDRATDRFWKVSLESVVKGEWRGDQGMHFELGFKLSDPLGYGTTLQEATGTLSGDPAEIVVGPTDLDSGIADVYPIYEFVVASSGFLVTVQTSLGLLAWGGMLTAGMSLKIDCDPRVQEIWTKPSGGEYTRNMGGMTGRFPALSPRVVNTVTVAGLDGASYTVQWRERFAAVVR